MRIVLAWATRTRTIKSVGAAERAETVTGEQTYTAGAAGSEACNGKRKGQRGRAYRDALGPAPFALAHYVSR